MEVVIIDNMKKKKTPKEFLIPIMFDDIFWEVHVVETNKKSRDEPIVELQWGWSAGMTDEERKIMDKDSPSGYKSLPITLSAAKRLANKINVLVEKFENK
jgi:hypothetical protein